jgi:hypothetical protein
MWVWFLLASLTLWLIGGCASFVTIKNLRNEPRPWRRVKLVPLSWMQILLIILQGPLGMMMLFLIALCDLEE